MVKLSYPKSEGLSWVKNVGFEKAKNRKTGLLSFHVDMSDMEGPFYCLWIKCRPEPTKTRLVQDLFQTCCTADLGYC